MRRFFDVWGSGGGEAVDAGGEGCMESREIMWDGMYGILTIIVWISVGNKFWASNQPDYNFWKALSKECEPQMGL